LRIALQFELITRRPASRSSLFQLNLYYSYCYFRAPDQNSYITIRLSDLYFLKESINLAIWMKFGNQIQNDMSIMMIRSKSKPKIEFQYGGCLFSKTRSSNISAVD